MAPKLILAYCVFAIWCSVCYTDESMISLLDEVAVELDKLETDYNAEREVNNGHSHSIGKIGLLTKATAAARIFHGKTPDDKKPSSDSPTSKNVPPKNRKWSHFIQRDMMVTNTLIKSMSESMLLRQLIDGCKAKQYTYARKLFAYLLRHDRMKAARTKGRRVRDPGKTGVSKMISEIRKLVGNQGFAKMMGLNNSVTLAFVIDTTGSMSDDIRQVKELVTRIVNTKRSSVVDYILSPFNDYSADFISKESHSTGGHFEDKGKFLKAVGALTADGGGDCPEMAIGGMENVFSHSTVENSPVFVITDAAAKDFKSSESYESMAELYDPITSIFVSKTTDCTGKKVINDYRSLVSDRGGFVLTFLPNSIELIENSLTGTAKLPVYRSKRKRRNSNRDEFFFHVDDTIDNLDIPVQSDAAPEDIKLFDSGGSFTSKGKVMSKGKGALYTIKNPGTGIYILDAPRGFNTVATPRGSSKENIDLSYYFTVKTRIGTQIQDVHSHYPIKGRSGSLVVTIQGFDRILPSTHELAVVDKNTLSILVKCTLRRHGKQPNRFSSTFMVPETDFMLLLKGKTRKNIPFHRRSNVIKPSYALVYHLSSPRGFQVSHTSSNPMIFAVHTYLRRERFDITVSPKSAVVRKSRYATVIPGRASLFVVRFKAAEASKKGLKQNCIVRVIGKASATTAHTVVEHHVI